MTAEGHQDRLSVRIEADGDAVLDQSTLKLSLEVEVVASGTISDAGGRVVDER